jgi:hypothetical protein
MVLSPNALFEDDNRNIAPIFTVYMAEMVFVSGLLNSGSCQLRKLCLWLITPLYCINKLGGIAPHSYD